MSEHHSPLVSVRDLHKHFTLSGGLLRKGVAVKAVDGVSFDIRQGDLWPGGRVRLRQIDPRARHSAAV